MRSRGLIRLGAAITSLWLLKEASPPTSLNRLAQMLITAPLAYQLLVEVMEYWSAGDANKRTEMVYKPINLSLWILFRQAGLITLSIWQIIHIFVELANLSPVYLAQFLSGTPLYDSLFLFAAGFTAAVNSKEFMAEITLSGKERDEAYQAVMQQTSPK